MKSVQRYTKSHLIRSARAECAGATLTFGKTVMDDPARKMPEAVRASPEASSFLGRELIKTLRGLRGSTAPPVALSGNEAGSHSRRR